MKHPLSPLLFALLLTTLLLPGCAYFSFTREPTERELRREQRYDDAAIRTEIISSLLRKNPAKANTVSVRSFNGHVFLIGEADRDFRNEATHIARNAQDVTQVTTHWFPSGTTLGGTDATTESNIESKILRPDPVRARSVAADVWGGHVVLTGLVNNQSQIDTAMAKIRQMKQVKSVTSYVTLY